MRLLAILVSALGVTTALTIRNAVEEPPSDDLPLSESIDGPASADVHADSSQGPIRACGIITDSDGTGRILYPDRKCYVSPNNLPMRHIAIRAECTCQVFMSDSNQCPIKKKWRNTIRGEEMVSLPLGVKIKSWTCWLTW
ncbi:hypothetical protein M011DRAFT_484906 [Sporormia fimetaria CBS 119925]|uniref:Uncharacterized protein n=1 Tax=Sporormia fimetaria CBS 119925 TaxID=1340428 RepID=A0A6A6VI38_9PLEO|nr:hypothetical protein M011DRAFT_484906 [Sporormia fimetaria CBS 119925]